MREVNEVNFKDVYHHHCKLLDVKPNSQLSKLLAGETGKDLASIDISRNYLGERGFQAFLEVIRQADDLTSLRFVGNGLTNDAVTSLARVLSEHSSVRAVDLRNNPLTLPAAMALVQMIRKNQNITSVCVEETFIEDRAKMKISRAIDRNVRLQSKAKATSAPGEPEATPTPPGGHGTHEETPFQRVKREHDERRSRKILEKNTVENESEKESIAMYLRRRAPRIPRRDESGWVILNVWISSTASDFRSELHAIHNTIIPKLNNEFKKRKVYILPFSAYHEELPPPQNAGTAAEEGGARFDSEGALIESKNSQLYTDDRTILSERLHLIEQCTPVFLMLVGDKHGPVPRFVDPSHAQNSAFSQDLNVTGGQNRHPMAVVESVYGGRTLSFDAAPDQLPNPGQVLGGAAAPGIWKFGTEQKASLYFVREPWRCLKIPEGITEAITDDCAYLMSDPEGKMRPGMMQQMPAEKYRERKTLWENWCLHKQVISSLPDAVALKRYSSKYDEVSATGELLLKGQDGFVSDFTSRLRDIVDYMYPDKETLDRLGATRLSRSSAGNLNMCDAERQASSSAQEIPWNETFRKPRAFAELVHDSASYIGRNNAVSKLELYLITPSSRNILLVHGGKESGVSSVMALFIQRVLPKLTYVVASCVVGHSAVANESHSLRTVLLGLCSQMLEAKRQVSAAAQRKPAASSSFSPFTQLPKHIVHEVRIQVLKDYFKNLITDVSAALPDGKVLVIIISGLERVQHPRTPLTSLTFTDTGKSILECTLNETVKVSTKAGAANVSVSNDQPPERQGGMGFARGGGGGSGATAAAAEDTLDWIPKCLPKNVRLVASCDCTAPQIITQMLHRGQDCCEAVEVMRPGVQESGQVMKHRLTESGITLSEHLFYDHILKKACITDVRYVELLTSRITQRYERYPESTPKSFFDSIPDDFDELLDAMLDAAEATSSNALVSKCLSALAVLDDGLLLLQLRKYLAPKSAGTALLSGHDVENLLHGIRPLLYRFVVGYHDFGKCTPAGNEGKDSGSGDPEQPDPEKVSVDALNRGVPINGVAHRLQLKHSVKRHIARRYMPDEASRVSTCASLAKFLASQSEVDNDPTTVDSLVAYPRMMVAAGMWSAVMRNFFNISTVRRFFQHAAGHRLFVEMVEAHTALTHHMEAEKRQRAAQAKSGSGDATPKGRPRDGRPVEELEAWLFKIREYAHFLVVNNTSLNTKPSLTVQQGLLASNGSNVYREAKRYFDDHPQEPHFTCVNKSSLRMGRGCVASVVFSNNGLRLLAASEKSFSLSTVTGSILHHVTAPFTVLLGLVSPTSRYAALVLVDKSVMVYDAVTGTCVTKLSGHTGRIRSCSMTARSGCVLTGSDDATLCIWDTESGRNIATLQHNTFLSITSAFASVSCCAGHPTDERVFLSSIDRTVLLWKRETLEYTLASKILAHSAFPVKQLVWLDTGDYFVVVCKRPVTGEAAVGQCHEACMRVFDGRSGDLRLRLGGAESSGVNHVALCPANALLGAALEDGTLLFWDIKGALASGAEEAYPLHSCKAFVYSASHVCFYIHAPADAVPSTVGIEGGDFDAASRAPSASKTVLLCAAAGDGNMLRTYRCDTFSLTFEHVCQAKIIDVNATSTPTSDGAHLAVGDATGRVYLLRESPLDV